MEGVTEGGSRDLCERGAQVANGIDGRASSQLEVSHVHEVPQLVHDGALLGREEQRQKPELSE